MPSSPHPTDPNYEAECKRQGKKPVKRSVASDKVDDNAKTPSTRSTTRK